MRKSPGKLPLHHVDNGQPGTSFTGSWCVSGATGPFGPDSFYSCGGGLDTYRWAPTLPAAGQYDVYVWWTAHPNRSTTVPITVTFNGGQQTFVENEQAGGSQWQLLGTFPFAAGGAGYVEVTSQNGQAAADAVRLVPR